MNLNLSLRVGARFKFVTHKGDGVPTNESPWFHNIVLDAGLDRMSVGGADNLLHVGSGNSEPVKTQTNLDVLIATTGNIIKMTSGRQMDTLPIYHWTQRTFRYNAGQAKGNLSEVGLGWDGNNCFNRALIKDLSGEPTTITVLEDDFLDVMVELRTYPAPLVESSFNVKNRLGDVVSTHTVKVAPLMTANPYVMGTNYPTMGKVYLGTPSDAGGVRFFKGIAEVTKPAVEPLEYFHGVGVSDNTYPSSRSCKGRTRLELGDTTNRFPIRSMAVGISYLGQWQAGQGLGYKMEIDPPWQKKDTQVVDIYMTVSWDRFEEPK